MFYMYGFRSSFSLPPLLFPHHLPHLSLPSSLLSLFFLYYLSLPPRWTMPTPQYQPVCSQCRQPSSKVGDKTKGLPRSHIEPYIAQSNAYIIHVTIYMHSSIISLLSPLLAHSYTGSYHYGYLGNLFNNCSISSFSSHQVFISGCYGDVPVM